MFGACDLVLEVMVRPMQLSTKLKGHINNEESRLYHASDVRSCSYLRSIPL